MPTFQKAIDRNSYFHISGEVLGAFYSGDDSIVAQNFWDKEYLFILKGYYKPISIVKVKNKSLETLPEVTGLKLDETIFVIFNISKTKIDGDKSAHEKLMVSYKNLDRFLYASDIYTYEEINNKISEDKYCESIKNRIFDIDFKNFPEIRKFYYYENIFAIAKSTGVCKKALMVFNDINESELFQVDKIHRLLTQGIEKQKSKETENYITVPHALERVCERISNSNSYTFNEKMITKVKLIRILIESIKSKSLTAIDRYTRTNFMDNYSKSIVIDNFITDILIDTTKFNKWLDKKYPIQKIKQEKKKSKEQIQREQILKDYLVLKDIKIGSKLKNTNLSGKTKLVVWKELEDYFLSGSYSDDFDGMLFNSDKINTINAFFRDAQLCSFAK
jgi:hypothetical protein